MIPTNYGKMSVMGVLGELTYISYSSNRERGMSATQLARMFGSIGAAMEARYQAERAIENARAA